MDTLHIRSVPDEVYEQLRSLAQAGALAERPGSILIGTQPGG